MPFARPAIGELFAPIVIEIAGSSTVISGSGRGSSGSARVSPMVISGMPATAMMSPGPADSAGTRSSASVMSSSVTLTRWTEPSRRHQAACWPFFMVPLWIRQQREPAEERRRVEVGDVGLQRYLGVVGRRRHRVEDRAEQRLEVRRCRACAPSAGRSSDARPAFAEA